ncbi:hypothetical protein [Prevotella sp. E13-27]|uniref:hypothetical protein n=1 Tax=Prevotella sp. E13-27 TaxID=2938122 RepID=UPI00200A0CFB|nr:hypothetical protein [Prevotella sp. E13-27]MCK8622613.1 hypothetical protein [Prevotella sp. E13-27]
MKKIILFIGAIAPPQDDIVIISAPVLSMEPYRTVVKKTVEVIQDLQITHNEIARHMADVSIQLQAVNLAELKRVFEDLQRKAELAAIEIKEAIEQYTHPEYRPNYDQRRQRLMAGHPHKTYWHRIRSNPG